MIKNLTLLLLIILTQIPNVVKSNQDDELKYRLPPFTVVSMEDGSSRQLSETYPGFLQKRGDFQRFKRITGNGKGIKVGVADTGLDYTHYQNGGDLSGMVEAKDFTGSRYRNYPPWADVVSGHGSHCAGHIGAKNNGKGIEGIASDCELYIAKVLNDRGFGSDRGIASGIDWLASKDVDIINLSLGGEFSQAIENAVQRATKKGILVLSLIHI